MEVNINIDEKKFNELISNELNSFSKEELHDIIRECLIKCMSDVNVFRNLFVYENFDRWNGSKCYNATDVLVEAAKTVNFSPLFKEFEASVLKYMKDNEGNVIKMLLLNIFMSGLKSNMDNQKFYDTLAQNIKSSL